jgi:hypothetical protein
LVLFFKAGWLRWLFGVFLLSALLWFAYRLRNVPTSFYSFPHQSSSQQAIAVWWVVAGFGLDLGLVLGFLLSGSLLLPTRFPRWVSREAARLFSDRGILLAAAAGAMAAFLEEPLFRMYVLPETIEEIGIEQASYFAALLFAAFYWTPYTNMLAIWAFLRFLLLSRLEELGGTPAVPMAVHGVMDFAYILLVSRLGRAGLTHIPPGQES